MGDSQIHKFAERTVIGGHAEQERNADERHEQGIRFRNVIYTSNLQAIMELVAIGYGVAFIFETHLRHRVQTQPIERYSFGNPKMVSDFVAAYRKGSYLPQYV